LIFSFKTNFGLQYLVQLAPQFALRGPRCEQSEQWGGVGTLSQHSASLMTRFVIKLKQVAGLAFFYQTQSAACNYGTAVILFYASHYEGHISFLLA